MLPRRYGIMREEQEPKQAFVDKHDGYVVVAQDVSFCAYQYPELNIYCDKILAKRQQPVKFKGINLFQQKETLVEIEFARFSDLCISQVFVNNGLGSQWPVNDYSIVRGLMIDALDYAITKLPVDVKRKILKRASSYKQIVADRKKYKDIHVNIPRANIPLFGKNLNKRLWFLIDLQEELKGLATTFCVSYKFGQNAKLEESLYGEFCCFNLAATIEYVVHFRRDFIPKQGMGAFWKRETVREKMGRAPDEEFYPGLISQYGNFYYYGTKGAERRNKDGIAVELTKFYTSLFSGVHNMKMGKLGRPFHHPYVRYYLENKLSNDDICLLDPETLTKKTKENIYPLQDVEARLELVVSNRYPGKLTPHNMTETFRNHITSRGYDQMVHFLDMEKVKTCVRRAVVICCNTIEEKVANKLTQERTNAASYIANPGDLDLTEVCEAIISFAFYGTALFADGKIMHDTKILNFLSLKKSNFKSGDVFRGLDALTNIIIHRDKDREWIQLTAEVAPGTTKRIFPSFGLPMEFHEIIAQILSPNFKDCLITELTELFVKTCIVGSKLGDPPSFQQIFNKIRRDNKSWERCKIVSSVDFIEITCKKKLKTFNPALTVLRDVLGQQIYDMFLQKLPSALDNYIYNERTYFIHSADTEISVNLIVLPLNKTDKYQLSNLNHTDTEFWRGIFKQVFNTKMFHGYGCHWFEFVMDVQDQNSNNNNAPIPWFDLITEQVLKPDWHKVDIVSSSRHCSSIIQRQRTLNRSYATQKGVRNFTATEDSKIWFSYLDEMNKGTAETEIYGNIAEKVNILCRNPKQIRDRINNILNWNHQLRERLNAEYENANEDHKINAGFEKGPASINIKIAEWLYTQKESLPAGVFSVVSRETVMEMMDDILLLDMAHSQQLAFYIVANRRNICKAYAEIDSKVAVEVKSSDLMQPDVHSEMDVDGDSDDILNSFVGSRYTEHDFSISEEDQTRPASSSSKTPILPVGFPIEKLHNVRYDRLDYYRAGLEVPKLSATDRYQRSIPDRLFKVEEFRAFFDYRDWKQIAWKRLLDPRVVQAIFDAEDEQLAKERIYYHGKTAEQLQIDIFKFALPKRRELIFKYQQMSSCVPLKFSKMERLLAILMFHSFTIETDWGVTMENLIIDGIVVPGELQDWSREFFLKLFAEDAQFFCCSDEDLLQMRRNFMERLSFKLK